MVSASDCSVRGPRFDSHRGRLCLSRQPLRYTALGTGCAPLLQCLGQLSLLPSVGWQNEYQPLGWVIIKWRWWMWMIAAYRRTQPKSIGLVWGLAATWRWVCIHQMKWVNSRNGATPWRQHHKYRRGIITIIIIIATRLKLTTNNRTDAAERSRWHRSITSVYKSRDWLSPRSEAKAASGWLQNTVTTMHVLSMGQVLM